MPGEYARREGWIVKCAVCNGPVEGKRLCEECDREVNEQVKKMADKYPEWFALKLRGVE